MPVGSVTWLLVEDGTGRVHEAAEGDNTPEDLARYVAEAVTPARQEAAIADPAGTVLIAEHRWTSGYAELVGYVRLVSGPPADAVQGCVPLELKRFYVARMWHGKGVAQALTDAALDAALARRAHPMARCVGAKPASGGLLSQVRVHARGRAQLHPRLGCAD